MEGGVGFGLGAGGIEERRAKDVHALDVDAGGGGCSGGIGFGGSGGGFGVGLQGVWVLEFGAAKGGDGVCCCNMGGGGRGVGGILAGVVERPGNGVKEADERIVGYAAFEKRVGFEGAEGVVADFGVGWGGATAGEGEVVFCGNGRGVEENKPDVDAEMGLEKSCVSHAY